MRCAGMPPEAAATLWNTLARTTPPHQPGRTPRTDRRQEPTHVESALWLSASSLSVLLEAERIQVGVMHHETQPHRSAGQR